VPARSTAIFLDAYSLHLPARRAARPPTLLPRRLRVSSPQFGGRHVRAPLAGSRGLWSRARLRAHLPAILGSRDRRAHARAAPGPRPRRRSAESVGGKGPQSARGGRGTSLREGVEQTAIVIAGRRISTSAPAARAMRARDDGSVIDKGAPPPRMTLGLEPRERGAKMISGVAGSTSICRYAPAPRPNRPIGMRR